MASSTKQGEPGTDVVQLPADLVKRFADMAVLIPDDTEDGGARMLDAILSAKTWEALNDPWESSNGEALVGKLLKLTSAKKMPSTFEGGLGIFLVIDYTDTNTGETGVLTTSAVSIVGQIAAAYAHEWMPLYAEVVVADRPTKRGFLPQHLKIHGTGKRPPRGHA